MSCYDQLVPPDCQARRVTKETGPLIRALNKKGEDMHKKIQIVSIILAAFFASSLIGTSGASAFTLWDQCTKTASPLEFKNADCTEKVAAFEWGWEEIKAKTAVDTLPALWEFSSNGITIHCEGTLDGTVGPGNEGEVIELLTLAEVKVTEANPLLCNVTRDPLGLCNGVGADADMSTDGLPWKTLLVAAGNILEAGPSGEAPGWLVVCLNGAGEKGLENLCDRTETALSVANLEAELEVDLTFNFAEKSLCTVGGAEAGVIEGSFSILLVNGNALRAM